MRVRIVPMTSSLQDTLLGRTRHSDANVAWSRLPVRAYFRPSCPHVCACVCVLLILPPSAAVTNTFPSGLDPWLNKHHSHSSSAYTHVCTHSTVLVIEIKREQSKGHDLCGSGDVLVPARSKGLRFLLVSFLSRACSPIFSYMTSHPWLFSV